MIQFEKVGVFGKLPKLPQIIKRAEIQKPEHRAEILLFAGSVHGGSDVFFSSNEEKRAKREVKKEEREAKRAERNKLNVLQQTIDEQNKLIAKLKAKLHKTNGSGEHIIVSGNGTSHPNSSLPTNGTATITSAAATEEKSWDEVLAEKLKSFVGTESPPPQPLSSETEELNRKNMESFIEIFPDEIKNRLKDLPLENLMEVDTDLERQPVARFVGEEKPLKLSDKTITREDLEHIKNKIGKFGRKNRAGMDETLHRFSITFNQDKQRITGFTSRAGRVVHNSLSDRLKPIFESSKSILILGQPGSGKTTLLRETGKFISELNKKVVVVDNTGEIGGCSDVAHPALGDAKRIFVYPDKDQADMMIEAVENLTPSTIVVDEISNPLQVAAARTVAERGVQLIATVHGQTFESLVRNPDANDLLGGIVSVTLGDMEAARRETQKTVLERQKPPTFDIIIERVDLHTVAVYSDVAKAVDKHLRGQKVEPIVFKI